METETMSNWLQAKEKATESSLEIDYPPESPMLHSAHANVAADDPSKNGIYKLEDFLSAHKAERDAQLQAREEADSAKQALPPAKKTKIEENVAPLKPVAVGARSSKHTILLHEKYQALGIPQPLFTYDGRTDTGWTAQVSFPGLDVEELQDLSGERQFNSKQEAKEALSEKALLILEDLEKQGKISKGKKQKSAGETTQQKEPGPNYIGQLLEFQRSTSSPQPTYTDYRSGNHFACLLTIDGHPEPFGSLDGLHSSKKEARQATARQAVEYFQAQGLWPEEYSSVGGIKKKKKTNAQPNALPDSISTSTATSAAPPDENGNAASSPSSSSSASYAHQLALLAHKLSFPTPSYTYTPHPSDKDFHTVSCSFRNAGAPHEGPLGEARNVFGKKKAKEECARLTLEYLKEVLECRLREGERVMRGVGGGEKVLGERMGRAVEGEGREMVVGGGGEGEESEGEVEFEDAVEEMDRDG